MRGCADFIRQDKADAGKGYGAFSMWRSFDFDSNYNRGGDAMFESWSDDAMETEAIYFGLGEDAVLLWKEGEEVDLPAATAAQEEMWAIAELPPQEVPQE